MATAVISTAAGAPPPVVPMDAQFFCSACNQAFENPGELRTHSKSERHIYNTKRKLSGLKPISQEAWDRKIQEAFSAANNGKSKGTSHLKAGKEKRQQKDGEQGPGPSSPQLVCQSDGPASSEAGSSAAHQDEGPPSPRRCLFDRRHFDTVDACLTYMEKKYSFFVPDREYCTDVPGLLLYLRQKLSEPPHQCICCNRPFPDVQSVRRHMFDKCHTRLCSEVYSRRGKADKVGTEQLQAELEPFYDFHGSVREVMERLTVTQKVAALVRYFDIDEDGRLKHDELAALWAAASDGDELSHTQYVGACTKAHVDPDDGLDADALGKLYKEGIADLNEHFAMLQEKLAVRRKKEPSPLPNVEEEGEDGEVGAAGDAAQQGAGEAAGHVGGSEDIQEDEDEDEDEGGDSEEEDSDSDVEVVECDDEDEFAEVMRVLGLERVDFTETGDLRLPNGAVAAHRGVAHIFKQRGTRLDPDAPGAAGGRKALGDRRTPLMLSNSPAATQVAMSRREAKRDGKRIIAMLRRKNWDDMKHGMRQNLLQTNRVMKCRTVRGDASGIGTGGR